MEKYHCTVDLQFDLFGLVSFANKNKMSLRDFHSHCSLKHSSFWSSADVKSGSTKGESAG